MEQSAATLEQDLVLDSLPDDVVASIEARDAWRRGALAATDGLEFVISDLASWPLGRPVRVAFLDGDTELHGKIAEATQQIVEACNLELDFGLDDATGEYRRWTTSDTEHAADIRVSFDMGGYWSLVGTDSNDPAVGGAGGPIGGGAGQRSLNLGGFASTLPQTWQGTTRHEFLHALAFHHAHQNLRGPCEEDFRWDDDPGYVPTRDAQGRFVPDPQGRRPGIYTYLSGPPNSWSRAKVDHNLRTANSPDVIVGPFDPASVMLYRFAAFFYKSSPSTCAPTGNGTDISDGDKRGLRLLYPEVVSDLAESAERSARALEKVGGQLESAAAPESAAAGSALSSSALQARLVELLQGRAATGG
jgi:hypothetical protein